MHAELEGATSMFIKNNPSTPEAPIPPSTLSQAGTMSVATSRAWDSKAVMSAWWVHSGEVSKTAPTGDYLPPGQFAIRGKKNFLPPAQLVLGFGVVFQISDESKARHLKHRVHDEQEKLRDDQDPSLHALQGDDEIDEPESEGDDGDSVDDPLDDVSEEDQERQPEDSQVDPARMSATSAVSSSEQQPQHTAEEDQPDPNAAAVAEDSAAAAADLDDENPPDVPHKEAQSAQNDSIEAEVLHEDTDSNDDRDDQLHVETAKLKVQEKHSAEASAGAKAKQAPHVRGKRGKQKKIASKYRDQDEEDREIAMKILGSAAGQAKAEEEAQARKAREEARELDKRRRREQHLRASKEGLEREEARRRQEMGEHGDDTTAEGQPPDARDEPRHEGDEDDEAEEQQAAMTILSNLVGTPVPGDDILAALPVCAPWSAMTKYKYKAKLQPGSQKKGKAIKEILGRWLLYLDRRQATMTVKPGNAPVPGIPESSGTGPSSSTTATTPNPATAITSSTSASATTSSANKAYTHQRAQLIDDHSQDPEKMWPKELELVKAWRESEIFNTVPVGKVRVMVTSFAASAGAAAGGGGGAGGGKKGGGGGGGGGGKGKGKASRGGKGTKRDRK